MVKKRKSKKKLGGTSSEERREEEQEREKETFGNFLPGLPKEYIFRMATTVWNKKEREVCPIFNEVWAIKIGNDVGFLPLCWNIDRDLYPLLRNRDFAKKLVRRGNQGFKLELANEYTVLPPEEPPEEPGEDETPEERKKREERARKREKLKSERRDPAEGIESLFNAIRFNKEYAVKCLLNVGVNVNAKNNQGDTPLHEAAYEGHAEVLQLLLAAPGIEVNAKNKEGFTPLHRAARNGHEACLRLLLAAPGIEVNAKSNDGATPLYSAAFSFSVHNKACVQLLMETSGVDVNPKRRNGYTPLHWAAIHGYEEYVRLLLADPRVNANEKNNNGHTPLNLAANYGNEACVRLLLAVPGVNVNEKDIDGDTPLHRASYEGHEACIKLLLANPEIDVNIQNSFGKTAFEIAKNEKIKKLIQAKILEQQQNQSPRTASSKANEASSSTMGGKAKAKITKEYVTYSGKKYVVRIGSKGGRYILVGADKKKIYLK